MSHVAGFLDGGLSVEEIVSAALPDVPPAAIYEALAYYYEHQAEIEADWEANDMKAVLADLGQQLSPEQLSRFRGLEG